MKEKMLDGKVAIISGASYGMGQTMAELFASEGAKVVMTARGKEKLDAAVDGIRAKGYEVTGVVADNKNLEDVKQVIRTAVDTYGDLDIVINNAAISYIGLITDMSDMDWNKIVSTNLDSLFYSTKSFLPEMINRKEGQIINISSMWGEKGASCEVAYSTTKGGVNSFTKSLAKEVAPSNISVNAISCGVIDTDMNSCFTKSEMQELKNEIPACRLGTPRDVGQLVLSILNSPSYMTGQIIGIDGGL